MLRQIAAGELREAIATVKRNIALPAVLGRICPAPCEKVCRRGDLDAAVSICVLKPPGGRRGPCLGRSVRADMQAAYRQARGDYRRGADGPLGRILSASIGPRLHHLRRTPIARRPPAYRDHRKRTAARRASREIVSITRLGVEVRTSTRIGPDAEFAAYGPASTRCCWRAAPRHASKREAGTFPLRNAASTLTCKLIRRAFRRCLPPAMPSAARRWWSAARPTARRRPRPSTSSLWDGNRRSGILPFSRCRRGILRFSGWCPAFSVPV